MRTSNLPNLITRTCLTALCGTAVCALVFGAADPASAKGISLIRDAETEHIIHQIAAPLFSAAGLDASAVQVHIVNDRTLNAFVAGGQKIFINTGLLLMVEDINEIAGVIAHETGHISGGHLARTHDAIRNASATSILAMALGAAAALGGQGQAGSAIIAGGQQLAERSFLSYSRSQESSADQAAVKILAAVGQSAQGLYTFLDRIRNQEALAKSRQDPYVRSHPLTRDRLRFLKDQITRSRAPPHAPDPASVRTLRRMQAKIHGFLGSPQKALRRYPESDQSIPARYARAAAYHRLGLFEKALAEADSLIAQNPNDPFFNELKGQILFESGKVRDAVAPYQAAVNLLPEAPLLRIGLAQAQIEANEASLLPPAIKHLEEATRRDRQVSLAWQQLAIAHGRSGDIGLSSLASAEYNLLIGRPRDAMRFAIKAEQLLPKGTPAHLRAQDLKDAANTAAKRRK